MRAVVHNSLDLNNPGARSISAGDSGNENDQPRKTTKRISFLVPTSVCPQISISSAGSVASVEDEE